MTKLVLHIGEGKTGTSYLQHCLAALREELALAGVSYPRPPAWASQEEISGNAYWLAPWMRGSTADGEAGIAEIGRMIDAASGMDVLLSGEHLYGFASERMEAVAELCERSGIGLLIVMYVRSVAGHMWSHYAQLVKRGKEARPFPQWLASTPYITPTVVERLAETAPFVLRNYDVVRDDLWRDFAGACMPAAAGEIVPPKTQANRSLTVVETEFMRLINLGPATVRQACAASGILTARPAAESTAPVIRESEADMMRERFESSLPLINRHIPPAHGISVIGPHDRIAERNVPREAVNDMIAHAAASPDFDPVRGVIDDLARRALQHA